MSPKSVPSSQSLTRESLIERLQASDPSGWEQLINLYRPLLFHWTKRAGVNIQDFDDVCQDVFCVVAQRIEGFQRGERMGSFRAWLREITRNICMELFRKERRVLQGVGGTSAAIVLQEIVDPHSGETDPSELVTDLLRRTIALVRGEFSNTHWAVFEKLTFEGCTPAEIAADLRLTDVNVRAIKSRIYRRLREELGDIHEPSVSAWKR